MRKTCIGVLLGATMLTACFEPTAPKLSKDDERALDAMMFLFLGLEDNTEFEQALTPWRREVKGRTVEFSTISKNGIYSSDEDDNRKLRQSDYTRYIKRIAQIEPCVFRFEFMNEFSNGANKEEFSWHWEPNISIFN
jgi:hypothetical protein